ncbi:MAG: response regulator transcription factor [Planctomycetes bacterium]|nr:response regulator transcription factor [Planctomycetota bacterium]
MHLVDDEPTIQAVFRRLAAEHGWQLRVHGSIAAFEARSPQDRPSCVVLDLELPDGSGLDVLERLLGQDDPPPVVFISGVASVPQAVRAVQLGSVDFVEKPFPPASMQATVARAIEVDRQRRQATAEHAHLVQRFARLSPREREVLHLVAQGAANKDVAERLGLSLKTVEAHRGRVMRKTAAGSLAELVRLHLAVYGARGADRRP